MAKTVLIVDDSSSLRTVVRLALASVGYEVLEAADGVEGLRVLDKAAQVDLIVSDVNMPRLDGISFVTQLRLQGRHRLTPVVMLTTEGDEALKQRGSLAGAQAWMVKPFRPTQLLEAVSRLLLTEGSTA